MRLTLAILLLLALPGCKGRSDELTDEESSRITSPGGWCEAYLLKLTSPNGGNTQVMLNFAADACGAGAVSFEGSIPDVQLRWLDGTTLEVSYPKQAKPTRNSSGDVIQCHDRKVRVILSEK
jgi:hypothetical protein